jgi:ADP-ribose pyrophosphatase YjhB (NUDIX family)
MSAAKPLTHAGGVVVRRDRDGARFLVVSAKRNPSEWVLPKGHIDPGETAEIAACREVLEESGVVASVRRALDVVEFPTPRGRVRAQFFLMDLEREKRASLEGRRRAWLTLDEALRSLPFDELRHLVRQASRLDDDARG